MTTVVCFGEMLLRLSPPGFERLFQSLTLCAQFGGSEANVAIGLARFGVQSRYVTRLPPTIVGDAAIRSLRAEGVNTDDVIRGGERLGVYFVENGAGQRPSVVTYDRHPSSFSTIDPSDIDWSVVLDSASWLHVTGITPALGPGPAACVKAAVAAARARGITVSFDLNYRATLWPSHEAAPVLQEMARSADLLIAGEDHLQPLLGIAPGVDAGQRVAETYGPGLVAITSRESRSATENTVGAVLWDQQARLLHVTPQYTVRIVDRIGAGDAFAAGLIYGLTSDRLVADTLRFAVAAGALKHTIPGDACLLSVADVDRLANGDASGRLQR
jgi:2-dehydro-3-deoxygluconokinase